MNLVEGLMNEIVRVTEIRNVYLEFQGGQLAAMVMKTELDKAKEAMASGDILQMMPALQRLKEIEL